jgi:hypothetical protein
MSLICSLYVAILFFLLTPGILLRIPKGGSKYAVAALHALIFGAILFLTRRFVWRLSASLEGFDANTGESSDSSTEEVSVETPEETSPKDKKNEEIK